MKIEFPPDVDKTSSGGNFVVLGMLAYIRKFSVFCTEVNIILIIGILLIFIDKKQIKQLVYTTVIKEKYKRIHLQ